VLPGLILVQNTSATSQRNWIEELLRRWCDEEEIDLVITIGGTAPAPGTSSTEIVPDATNAVIERSLPGIAEAMRSYAVQETALAWLDRSTTGIRGRSLLINLPANAAPALLFLEAIIDLLEPALSYLQLDKQSPRLSDYLTLEPVADGEGMETLQADKDVHGLNTDEFAAFLQRDQS